MNAITHKEEKMQLIRNNLFFSFMINHISIHIYILYQTKKNNNNF